MKVEKDYEEFFRLLNKHEVKYCIIGAYAVAFYAKPRYTKDIDILIEPTPTIAQRLTTVLDEFGFGDIDLSEKELFQTSLSYSYRRVFTGWEAAAFMDL